MPTVAAEIGGGVDRWLLDAEFWNDSATETRTVLLTDSAGDLVWQAQIPPKSMSIHPGWTLRPVLGLKWVVDGGTDVVGHVWAY